MRATILAAAAILLCAAPAPLLAQKQVAMFFTVADREGKEAAFIDPAGVNVVEDGQPLAITKVEPVERVPKLQVLIDNGVGFPSTNVGDLRNAIKGLINALQPGLEVTLVTTAPAPRFLQKATTSRTQLLAAIDKLTLDEHAGKFVDSLYEAAARANTDPVETAVHTIVTIGTTVGDANAKDADVNKTMEWIQAKEIPVFVVLMANVSASTGATQTDLGMAASKAAGGLMEVINNANRLITLMPEIGTAVAATTGGRGHQFRVVAQRTAVGPLGKMAMSVKGMTVVDLALDRSLTK